MEGFLVVFWAWFAGFLGGFLLGFYGEMSRIKWGFLAPYLPLY